MDIDMLFFGGCTSRRAEYYSILRKQMQAYPSSRYNLQYVCANSGGGQNTGIYGKELDNMVKRAKVLFVKLPHPK